jgi:hypothetical protein
MGHDPMNAEPITLSMDDRRLLGQWAADCAERVLALYEVLSPSDPRPREAIDGIRIFARGGDRTVRLRTVALEALDAARETDDPAAAAAARAAGFAASTAYTKALANPHHAKHALGPAVYAARARELAGSDPAMGDEELRWAIAQAPAAVREIVSRWPARATGRTRLSALFFQLDAGLRGLTPP